MADQSRELVVIVTHGIDHEMSSVGFTIANGGITSGLKVAVFLTSAGVDVVRKKAADTTQVKPLDPLADLVRDFVARTGAAMDPPEAVARVIINAIEEDRSEVYVGWPERFFVRVNAIAPGLVDRSLAAQNRKAPGSVRRPAGAR